MIQMIDGKAFWRDARNNLVPAENVRPQDQLQDEVVRKILSFAEPLSAQIVRFRDHTMADVTGFVKLIEQEYGAKIGGAKGNITLTSFDGLMKVQVQVADRVEFGPELQVAKTLVDECLREWSADSRAELQAIVMRAFQVDKAGCINRAEILSLLRLEIADERWQRAMKAVRDSMRTIGTKEYVRFYRRASVQDNWTAISIDIAAA